MLCKTEQLLERDGADLARTQGALQSIPAETSGKEPLSVEHEIAAIGAMQRARDDQVEIGDERAKTREMLDAADQVLMGRLILIDDRRTCPTGIVDEYVDLVAAERRHPLGHRSFRLPGIAVLSGELLGMLEDVALDFAKIGHHRGEVSEGGAHLLQKVPHHDCRRVAVELADRVAMFALPIGILRTIASSSACRSRSRP